MANFPQALVKKRADVKGRVILQDLEHIVVQANVGTGIEVMGIDFFKDQPVKGSYL